MVQYFPHLSKYSSSRVIAWLLIDSYLLFVLRHSFENFVCLCRLISHVYYIQLYILYFVNNADNVDVVAIGWHVDSCIRFICNIKIDFSRLDIPLNNNRLYSMPFGILCTWYRYSHESFSYQYYRESKLAHLCSY